MDSEQRHGIPAFAGMTTLPGKEEECGRGREFVGYSTFAQLSG